MSSIATQRIVDHVTQSVRSGLEKFAFRPLTTQVMQECQAATNYVLHQLVQQGVVEGYNITKSDAQTGQIAFQIQPSFPLQYIQVSMSLDPGKSAWDFFVEEVKRVHSLDQSPSDPLS